MRQRNGIPQRLFLKGGSWVSTRFSGCRLKAVCGFQHLFEAPTREWSGLRWGGRTKALEFDGHAALIVERCFIHTALSLRCSGNQSGGSFNRYLSLTISSSGSFLMHARTARPRSGTFRLQLHSVRIKSADRITGTKEVGIL